MRRSLALILAMLMATLLGTVSGKLLHAESAALGREAPLSQAHAAQTAHQQPAAGESTLTVTGSPRLLLPFLVKPGSAATSSQPNYLALTYKVDRSGVPPLYYQALTLLIDVGRVDAVEVSATDSAGNPVPVDYVHDPESQTVAVTTSGSEIHVLLVEPQNPENAGSFEKAALKGNARWAWSHSLDDNTFLNASIAALQNYGYRGTLYLIGKKVDDTREEDWIIDAPDIHRLLADGWSIGNHTWDHTCDVANIDNQTIISGYKRLGEVVAASPVPEYRVIAFAAPCFKDEYHPLIQEMVAGGTTDVQFNESDNRYLLVVDSSAADYSAGEQRALSFDYAQMVGRDAHLALEGGVAEAMDILDWMSANASADRHFWYNTFTHSGEPEEVEQFARYVYENYGAGGSGEVWVAPADEIYSYLLVRDHTTVSFSAAERVPVAVEDLNAAAHGDDLVLSWPAPPGATATWTVVHRAVSATFAPDRSTRLTLLPSTTTTFTDTGVLADPSNAFYAVQILQPAPVASAPLPARAGAFTFLLQSTNS